VNLQSGNTEFQISIDDHEISFGNAPELLQPVPWNCSYDFSVMGLKDDDRVFKIEALWPMASEGHGESALRTSSLLQSGFRGTWSVVL
jgi:hypothetical protein